VILRNLAAIAIVLTAAACSESSGAPSTTVLPAATIDSAVPPAVDRIDQAVAALEAELGGPQRYFEINATGSLVNLFLAFNADALVQPWVYRNGELSSQEAQPAQGNSFAADALDFDPETVLDGVTAALPGSSLTVFVVEGGPNGSVQYSVVVDSASGGQLVVVVASDGRVLSVDPV
jgi:ABC-type glycerol-3-phosphate transport system substrate-binding protein